MCSLTKASMEQHGCICREVQHLKLENDLVTILFFFRFQNEDQLIGICQSNCFVSQNKAHLPDCLGSVFFS